MADRVKFRADVVPVSGRAEHHVRFVNVAHVKDEQQSDHQHHVNETNMNVFGLVSGSRGHWRSTQSQEHPTEMSSGDHHDDEPHQLRVPLMSVMETETLHILQDMEKSYRCNLGSHHNFTADARKHIQTLRRRIDAKGQRSERDGPLAMMSDWVCRLTSLTTGRDDDDDDEESRL